MERRDKNGLTEAEFLASYHPGHYERPSLTADVAVFSRKEDELHLLLVERGGHPYLGCYALPGGFANKNEAVEETAARELTEETGLAGLPLVPVGFFSAPGRDPRGWVVSQAFAAMIPPEKMEEVRAGDDAAAAHWFCLKKQQEKELLRLTFSDENTAFSAVLSITPSPEGSPAPPKIRIRENGGLAFDHARIIGCALHAMNLLK